MATKTQVATAAVYGIGFLMNPISTIIHLGVQGTVYAVQQKHKAEAREKLEAEAAAKAAAEAEANAKAKAMAEAEAWIKAEAEAQARADAEVQAWAKAQAEAQARADAEARVKAQQAQEESRERARAHARAQYQAAREAAAEAAKKYQGPAWAENLGIPSNSVLTYELVRSYYRQAVKRTHPDKGGNPARFHCVQRAWEEAQRHVAR